MKSRYFMALCTTLAMVSVSGCGSSSAAVTTEESPISGSIQIVGSTSMEEMCTFLAEVYMEEHQEATISNEYVGSTAGIEALLSGTADIGTSSRNLTEEELDQGAVENVVARDGIVVIVNRDVEGVTALTAQQIADIFTGTITNWQDVGGPDLPIITIGHEAGSGTRDPFEEILDIVGDCTYSNELSGSGAVLARVAEASGSVGYCSMAIADDSVLRMTVNGVEPSKETVQTGEYILNKTMVMATAGPLKEQAELVQDYMDFVYSDAGQKLIEEAGLTPVGKQP